MDIEQIIEGIDQLSPSLKLLPKLQELLNDEDATIHDIGDLIKLDPALTAQVLKLCNSSAFGATSDPTSDIDEALNRIGSHEVYKIVALSSAGKLYNTDLPFYKLIKNDILETSARCASIMQDLAEQCELSPSDAYVTGLLHKLGKLIVHSYILEHEKTNLNPDDYPEGLTPEDEVEILGYDRCKVASLLLQKWGFPEDIYFPIERMLNPLDCDHSKCAALLAIAHSVASTIVRNPKAQAPSLLCETKLLEHTGLSKDEVIKALVASDAAVELIHSVVE